MRKTTRKRTSKARTNVEKMRAEFATLQRNGANAAGLEVWRAAVVAYVKKHYGDNPTAQQWVTAAEKAVTYCDSCSGSGTYCWGAVVNGRPTHSGTCFRCGGKGYQNQSDYRRNWVYDQHRRAV